MPEGKQDVQGNANRYSGVGDIETGEVPSSSVKIEEIGYVAKSESIDEIANDPPDYQPERPLGLRELKL